MFDFAGVRAAGDAFVWGVGGVGGRAGGPAGRAGCVDRGVAGRVGGVAAAGRAGTPRTPRNRRARTGRVRRRRRKRPGRQDGSHPRVRPVGLGVSRVGSRGIAAAAWRWWPPPTSASRSNRRAAGAVVADWPARRERSRPACRCSTCPRFSLAVTEYLMMRRICGCGHATTADLPAGVRGGPTCYGPNVTAAATLLASQDVLGIERTADLMSALLGVAVSTGFISSLPDPPGRRADHGRVRTGAQGGAARRRTCWAPTRPPPR